MIKEIANNLFQITAVKDELRQSTYNSYLICAGRSLLIDPGDYSHRLGFREHTATLEQALAELNIDRDNLDFFATHMHWDHVGSVESLAGKRSVLYIHETASVYSDVSIPLDAHDLCGIPEETAACINEGCLSSGLPETVNISYLSEVSKLSYGDYELVCIHTPGHAVEHACLYEERKKMLFSGDMLLSSAVPCILSYSVESDNRGKYLKSLEKLEALDIEYVFPGHGKDIDFRAIENTRRLHSKELQHQLDKLSDEPKSVAELLSGHKWDINRLSPGQICPMYFRVFSILNYLEKQGLAKRIIGADGIHRFASI